MWDMSGSLSRRDLWLGVGLLALIALTAVLGLIFATGPRGGVIDVDGREVTVDGVRITASRLTVRHDPGGDPMVCSLVSLSNESGHPVKVDGRHWSLEAPGGVREIFSFATTEAPGLASGGLEDGQARNGDVCFYLVDTPGRYTLYYAPDGADGTRYAWTEVR